MHPLTVCTPTRSCFDEFNRLREDQLSAVSQQIQVIQVAIKERAPAAQLLGRTVEVNANAGIFVTLNPAGKGYGGRSRLPDNLKALFRPVAMSKPDNELIAEVVLYSEGFMTAKELGRKMVSLFTVSSQLLSSQQHYDWGLRAMKACLTTGGSLIAAARQSSGLQRLPAEAERELLIKAVRVNTLSKLTYDDSVRFLGLMGDVFPGTRSEDIRDDALEAAIRAVMAAKPFCLEFDAGQMRKMLQLKEALGQRMGCVVVGPSGCGKSTLWRVLQAALVRLGQPVVVHVMNPKSMPRSRLLGEMDPDTREWTDGVLTSAARQVVREPLSTRSWVVCDGDVDPEWIESLNSVLDDNHLLTLPNGERIAFNDNVNFIFETHDLRFASPATVSRMGMIFLSDDNVDVRRVAKCWLAAQPEAPLPAASTGAGAGAAGGAGAAAAPSAMAPAPASALATWVDSLFFRALDWVRAAPRGLVVDTTLVGTVLNGLSHLSGGAVRTRADFCLALVRGLGGNLDSDSRAHFARDVFAWAGERLPDANAPLDVQADARGELVPIVAATAGSSASGAPLTRADVLAGAVVTTVSLQRAAAVVAPWMERMEPFVLVGPEGCGKSLLVQHLAAQRRNTSLATLHCNAQTTAEHVVQKIRQGCSLFSANSGRVFRPREGDRLVLFLKDINLPKPDKYNTCGLIAFLQQLLTFRGFYDEHLEFLGIERVHIVCTMNPATTVGRHPLSTRFTATVRIAALDYPDARELAAIAGSYLSAALAGVRVMDERFRGAAAAGGLARLAGSMVEVYSQARARFSVDEHRHYLFTPRDLTAWVVALLRYPLATERSVVDVLAYEAARIFRDRLVGAEACQRFDALLAGTLKQHWGAAPELRDVFFTALAGGGGSAGKGTGSAGAAGAAAAESKQGEGASTGTADASSAQGLGAPLVRQDGEGVRQLAERGLVLFEREERDLGVLLFPEALEHVAQVDRVLSRAGGSLLLVGRPGAGRRSSATLVAFMHGMKWVSPAPPAPATATGARDAAASSLKAFFAELKGALYSAGVAGEDTVLYLEDHQLGSGGDDSVLEAVNSLLSSGEVPGLYSHEEQEQLLAPLRPLMSESGFSFRSPWDFFTHRVRARLHVCLALDPTHPSFAERCQKNPALFTRCGILWFGAWREQSLRAVAQHTLADVLEQASAHVAPAALVAHALALHASVESGAAGAGAGVGAATPRAFVALLRSFRGLYQQRAGGLQGEAGRLRSGLGKLLEAQETVDELSKSAGVQRAQLREKQAAADAAMSDITDALAGASDRRREVEQLQREVARADGEARRRKAALEAELGEIQPVLDEAKAAVGAINKANLDEIRALKMPPEAIADVLSAVLLLLGIADTSWNSMKKFLSGRGVIQDILSYDAHSLTAEARAEVAKVMRAKAESFKHENIYRASVAAAPLAAWVKANVKYAQVLEKIAPLEAELAQAAAAVERCGAELAGARAELDQTDVRVQQLKASLGKRTAEAEGLKIALARTEDTLGRAQSLLSQLGGEKERWEHTVAELARREAALALQVLLAAGFVTYLTGGSEDVREAALAHWALLLEADAATGAGARTAKGARAAAAAMTRRFDILRLLSSEGETLAWKAAGLPADALSLQNAVAIFASAAHSGRVPFVLDPSSQATDWLQRFLEADSRAAAAPAARGAAGKAAASGPGSGAGPLEVVLAQDARFANQVELAVRFGKTLFVREADRVEPLLYPLLRRDLTHQGPRLVVQIGDKAVDFNERFRLFLASRSPRPNLPPDAAALVTQVNFTTTRSGLEGQLLGLTLQSEDPELEAQKSLLLRREEELKVQITACEEDLLSSLAASSGSLLENQQLLASLTATKAKSEAVAQALEGSARASEELDAQRDAYRPFAAAGARLFFALGALAELNAMYVFGLAFFQDLFRDTLAARRQAAAQEPAQQQRQHQLAVLGLVPVLEARVLLAVGRSLLKADRLTFALQLVHAMHPELFGPGAGAGGAGAADDEADSPEWRFFMGESEGGGGSGGVDGSGGGGGRGGGEEVPLWVSGDRAPAFRALAGAFPHWVRALGLQDSDKWGRWYRSSAPERDFPAAALRGGTSTAWQRVLLLQALRPDRTMSALQAFACDALGVPSITPPAAALSTLCDEDAAPRAGGSPCALPVLMITTSGADPSRELGEFAAQRVGRERYTELAMGGGQQDAALRQLRRAAAEGDWLCLKNLHLVTAWLPTLEKELNSLRGGGGGGGGGGGVGGGQPSVSPHFRLWLTSECHAAFPPELLQNSVKVAYEAPPGLRKNAERTYEAWSAEYVAGGSVLRAQCLLLLAWFHGIVQERRTYVPQGWTKAYEFSFADLRAGAHVVDTLLGAGGGGGAPPDRVPWAFLHGLLENSVYGGRIDNLSDARVLRAFLAQVFHPDVLAGRRPLARGVGALPARASRDDALALVAALPDADQPHLFALPDNIERAAQRAACARVVAALKALRSRAAGRAGRCLRPRPLGRAPPSRARPRRASAGRVGGRRGRSRRGRAQSCGHGRGRGRGRCRGRLCG